MANGVVYVGSDDYSVYALKATTGAKLWSFATGFYVCASAAVANGVVYIASEDNNVYALNAITGAELWRFATAGFMYPYSGGSPSVADGVVYVGSISEIVNAFDLAGGRLGGQDAPASPPDPALLVPDGSLKPID